MAERILYAIGHVRAEEIITKYLSQYEDKYEFIGSVVHRDAIIPSVREKGANIVVIKEGLPGSGDIFKIVINLRLNFPNVRVVFIAKNRKIGDKMLANLIAYSVYDLLYGERITTNQMAQLIDNPNKFRDVNHLLPQVYKNLEIKNEA